MKLSLYIVILFFSLCNTRSNQINKILIKYVDYDLETVYKINCDDFEKQFGSSIHSHVVTNSSDLNKFCEFERKLKLNSKKYDPDVRAKIIIYKDDGTKDTLCLDGGNSAELNGTPMLINDDFVAFIKKIE
jgi:hypothetical protein